MHSTFPAPSLLLILVTLMIFGEEYELCGFKSASATIKLCFKMGRSPLYIFFLCYPFYFRSKYSSQRPALKHSQFISLRETTLHNNVGQHEKYIFSLQKWSSLLAPLFSLSGIMSRWIQKLLDAVFLCGPCCIRYSIYSERK
jgi:hypothetical protein